MQQDDDVQAQIEGLPNQDDALGAFVLSSLIGKGSFGEVFKAQHIASGKKVAIKIVRDVLYAEQLTRGTLREASLLRQFTSMQKEDNCFPHTVTLRELVLFKSQDAKLNVAFVLSYHKYSLRKILQSSKTVLIDQNHAKIILYSILCSLNFLHSAGVMHRDIKPDNFLLSKDCKVLLCDFGLSRLLTKEPSLNAESRDGISAELKQQKTTKQKRERQLSPHVCTRYYRPPEVILLNRHYDEKVDLWSAGCIGLELLTCSTNKDYEGSWRAFQGEKCYPLSPGKHEDEKLSIGKQKDQMEAILQILGKQDEDDLSWILFKKQRKHIDLMAVDYEKVDLAQEFPATEDSFLRIVRNCLEFNPYFRQSCKSLLASAAFDEIRDPRMEADAPWEVETEVDDRGEFDYESCKSTKFKQSHYLQMLMNEVTMVARNNNY